MEFSMNVKLEISEEDIKDILCDYLSSKLGDIEIDKKSLDIQVKSKQNYKSEWEIASFKATYNHITE